MRHQPCDRRSAHSENARHPVRWTRIRAFHDDRIASRRAGFLTEETVSGNGYSYEVASIFSTPRLLLPVHSSRATLPSMNGLGTFIMLIVAAVLLALLGLALVRRVVPRDRLARHIDVAGYVYAVIGVIYAVILAQVVIAAWQQYQDARAVADDEANAVLNLARLAQVWPDDDRERVQDALSAYAQHVVDIEWPDMAQNEFDESLHTALIHDLWQVVNEAGVRAEGLDPVYAASLQQLDALDEARRSRVLLGRDRLPEAMTLTLIIGAVVTVGFSYLFAVEEGWIQGLMTASLATLVALLLLLEYQLDTPYGGVSAIEPTAMELVRTEIDAGLGVIGGQS
jgi:fumarate reductase subunit D